MIALWVCLGIAAVLIFFWLYAIAPRMRRRPDFSVLEKFDYAHRGLHDASRGIPENSLPAFQHAVDHGYGMEFDLQLTKDGQVVVHHDNSLKRICGVDRLISDLTYEELQEIKLAGTEYSCPLFREVLELVDGKTPLIIEYKGYGSVEALCEAAWEILKEYSGPYCIESFHPLIVSWFREHHPEVIRGQLMSRNSGKIGSGAVAAIGGFLAAHLFSNFMTRPDFEAYDWKWRKNFSLKTARKLFGLREVSWTVRDMETYLKLKDDGCLCIFENFLP